MPVDSATIKLMIMEGGDALEKMDQLIGKAKLLNIELKMARDYWKELGHGGGRGSGGGGGGGKGGGGGPGPGGTGGPAGKFYQQMQANANKAATDAKRAAEFYQTRDRRKQEQLIKQGKVEVIPAGYGISGGTQTRTKASIAADKQRADLANYDIAEEAKERRRVRKEEEAANRKLSEKRLHARVKEVDAYTSKIGVPSNELEGTKRRNINAAMEGLSGRVAEEKKRAEDSKKTEDQLLDDRYEAAQKDSIAKRKSEISTKETADREASKAKAKAIKDKEVAEKLEDKELLRKGKVSSAEGKKQIEEEHKLRAYEKAGAYSKMRGPVAEKLKEQRRLEQADQQQENRDLAKDIKEKAKISKEAALKASVESKMRGGFSYEAMDYAGTIVKGKAQTEAAARKEIKDKGLYETDIKKTDNRSLLGKILGSKQPRFTGPLTDEESKYVNRKDAEERARQRAAGGPAGGGGGTGGARDVYGNKQMLAQRVLKTRGIFGSRGLGAIGAETVAQNFGILGIAAAGVGATLILVGKALEASANAYNTFAHVGKSTAQKMRAFEEGIPVVGDFVKGFNDLRDALNGVTEGLRQQAEKFEIGMIGVKGGAGVEQEKRAQRGIQVGLTAAAGEVFGGILGGPSEEGGIMAERRYALYEKQLPILHQQASLKREIAVSEAKSSFYTKEDQKLQGRLLEETAEKVKFDKEHEKIMEFENKRGGGTGPAGTSNPRLYHAGRTLSGITPFIGPASYDMWMSGLGVKTQDTEKRLEKTTAINDAQKENLQIQKTEEMIAENNLRLRESSAETIRKEGELRKTNIEMQKTELEFVKEKEQRAKGQLSAWGMANRGERAIGMQIIRRVKESGFESATEFEKSLLQKLGAGDFVEQEARKVGLQDPMQRAFAEEVGDTMKDQLKDLQKQKYALQADITTKIELNEETLAKEMAKNMDPLIERFIKALETKVGRMIEEATLGHKVRAASNKASS